MPTDMNETKGVEDARFCTTDSFDRLYEEASVRGHVVCREEPNSVGNDCGASYETPAVANSFPGENQCRLVHGRAAWRHCSCGRAVTVEPV